MRLNKKRDAKIKKLNPGQERGRCYWVQQIDNFEIRCLWCVDVVDIV